MKNEVSIMNQLDNSHILKLYDYFEDDNYIYLIVEFCNGGNLNDYIFNKNPDVQECLTIFAQILRGFRCIHEKGFLHRDLKPENILKNDNCFKIADFGLSNIKSNASTFCGSSYFMAPEILMH